MGHPTIHFYDANVITNNCYKYSLFHKNIFQVILKIKCVADGTLFTVLRDMRHINIKVA